MDKLQAKVSGLAVRVYPCQERPRTEASHEPPSLPSGYGLLVRLCRETLGS